MIDTLTPDDRHGIPFGKRVLYSFTALLLALLVLLAFYTIPMLVQHFHDHDPFDTQALNLTVAVTAATGIVALPVWVLILPFVWWLEDAEGWRGWTIWVVGLLYAPLILLVYPLLNSPHDQIHFSWTEGTSYSLFMAEIVSLLTTTFYFTYLKTVVRRARHPIKNDR
ncbi:MAG TPA: hypothetical protein VGB94_09065 [Acidobacteriaceae bacterium]